MLTRCPHTYTLSLHDALPISVRISPTASVPKLHLSSVPLVIVQPVTAGHTAHLYTLPNFGSESVSITLSAAPVPSLFTTIVNEGLSPTLKVPPSGVLMIVTCGGWQV